MDCDCDWYYYYYWYYWCFVSVNDVITIYWNEFKAKYCRLDKSQDGFFNLLPDEIVLNIFKYTSKKTLSNVIQVNRRFYRIGHDKYLWHRFDLRLFLGPSPQANLPMVFHNFLNYYYSEDTPYKTRSYSEEQTHCVLTPTEIREIIGNKANVPLFPSFSQKVKFRAENANANLNTTPHTATREDLKRLKIEVTNQHLYKLLLNSIRLLCRRMHYSYPDESIQDKNCRQWYKIHKKENFVEVVLNFSEYLLHSINGLEITSIDDFRSCKNGHIGNISDRLYCLIYLLQICKVFKTTKYIYRLVAQTKLLNTIITNGIID